jgi:hypothetical protein
MIVTSNLVISDLVKATLPKFTGVKEESKELGSRKRVVAALHIRENTSYA